MRVSPPLMMLQVETSQQEMVQKVSSHISIGEIRQFWKSAHICQGESLHDFYV